MQKKYCQFSTYSEPFFVFLLLVIAFLFRFWHLTSTGWVTEESTSYLGMMLQNHSIFHFSDSDYYLKIANDYLNGKGFNIPFPPPGTIFFLIFLNTVTGGNLFLMKVGYALIGSLALLPVYCIARELFDKAVACTTLTLCAVSFTLIFLCGGLNIESVYLFFLTCSLGLYTILYFEKGIVGTYKLSFSFLVGISAGLATLTRSEFLLVLGFMVLFLLLKKGWKHSLKLQIIFFTGLGFASVITPWTYRNYTFLHEYNQSRPEAQLPLFVPVVMNGPLNFLEGHYERATGTYAPDLSGNLDGKSLFELNPGNSAHLNFVLNGYTIGWNYILEHPERELEMIPLKIEVFLNAFSNGFFLNNFPLGLSGEIKNRADSFVSESKLGLFAGLTLFVAGLFFIFTNKNGSTLTFLPPIMLGIVLLVTLIFYGLSRMLFPVLPFYYMVISVSLVAGANRLSLIQFVSTKKFLTSALFLFFAISFYQSRGMYVVKKTETGYLGGYTLTYSGKVTKP